MRFDQVVLRSGVPCPSLPSNLCRENVLVILCNLSLPLMRRYNVHPPEASALACYSMALSEENYLLAQTNILHLATIDFSRFIRIGLSEYTPFHEFRVFL
jgi:hypothetical protein